MTSKTILFATVAAAVEAYKTLQAMIDVTIDCNAITYNNRLDEETVRWLVEDYYCDVRVRKRIYPYLVKAIAWVESIQFFAVEIRELMKLSPQKCANYQRGLRAASLMASTI